MKIIIKKGEPLWSEDGYHILDDNGFAVLSDELHKEIIITNPDAIERVKKSIHRDRWDEIYLLAINSSEQFLKDKEVELPEYEKEKFDLSVKEIQEKEKEIKQKFLEEQQKILTEQQLFVEEQKKIKAQQEAEFASVLKQKEEENAAAIAKAEAEMAEFKKKAEPIIAERKRREAEEKAAAEAEKKAQEQLIAELLERIKNLENKQ